MKILVIGFPRSGTTLTYNIIKQHPQVVDMWFEKWMLKKAKNKEDLFKKYPHIKGNSGEKVIWAKRVVGKIGKTTETIIDYALQWNDWFVNEARIIQIVRHPFDSLNSLVKSKKRFPRGPSFDFIYPEYLEYANKFFKGIEKLENCLTIKYENLVMEPEKNIEKIYKHSCLDSSFKFPGVMRENRVFNYKDKELLFEYDNKLENIIQTLNTIEGIKYDL